MSEQDLKACPFCGSEAKLSHSRDGEVCNVRCVKWGDGCMGAGANHYNESSAIEAWNRRASGVQAQQVQAVEYPPLPVPAHRGPSGTGTYFNAFTAVQMRAYVDADRASSGATTAQTVRMLTDEKMREIYARVQRLTGNPASVGDALIREFCAVNAGRTIPASGEIGSASIAPQYICKKCGTDRFKAPCPGLLASCPVKFDGKDRATLKD